MICAIDPAKSPAKDITGIMSYVHPDDSESVLPATQEPIVHNGELTYA